MFLSQAAQAGGGPAVFGPIHGRPAGPGWLAVQGRAAAGWGPACPRRPGPRHEPHGRPQGEGWDLGCVEGGAIGSPSLCAFCSCCPPKASLERKSERACLSAYQRGGSLLCVCKQTAAGILHQSQRIDQSWFDSDSATCELHFERFLPPPPPSLVQPSTGIMSHKMDLISNGQMPFSIDSQDKCEDLLTTLEP